MKNPQPTLSRHLRLLEEQCGVALLRRDTHRMSLTEAGQRLLTDAQTMLAHAQEADQRLREGQTTLSGHLRLFATIDLGQSIITRLVSRFLQANPKVTAELGLSSRPLHLIQEGCDVAILPGKITDESVIARPAGKITLELAASPSLVKERPPVRVPADLEIVALDRDCRASILERKGNQTLRPQPCRADAVMRSLNRAVYRFRDAALVDEKKEDFGGALQNLYRELERAENLVAPS
ncbi:MAG TPA: LysR family transcriptional regulator [Chthoniobacterales bacterium]|nr:LysR family transcriptional regulator [Chthoniobacterales bacterium]